MDSTAIKEIQQSQTTAEANAVLNNQKLDTPVAALPDNFKLNNLEQYRSLRSRFRGQLATKSIDSFSAYAALHKQSGSAVFIDADTMKAKLFINLGDQVSPGHCDHTATVSLEKCAAYTELLKIVDQRKSQKEIAEFIEDWRSILTASGEQDAEGICEKISIVRALHAVRKITIEAKSTTDSETRTFGATNTSMDSIDVKSMDMPPSFLHFTCEPFSGLSPRTFTLRLSVITDRAPALVLRIVRFEEHEEEMAKEFQSLIVSKIDPEIKTYVGSFAA